MDDHPPMTLALDLSSDGFAWVGANERYRWVNRAYAERMGFSRAAMVGMTMSEVLGPAMATARPHVDAALAGQRRHFTVRGPHVRGQASFEVTYRPVTAANGERDGFVSMLREVTEVAEATSARAEMEHNFTVLFNTIRQGFALHELVRDASGEPVDLKYLEVNPAFEALTKIPRDRWIGRTMREVIGFVDPFWVRRLAQVSEEGEAARIEHGAEGSDRIYEAVAYPAGSERVAVVIHDVTEARAQEEALRQGQRLESLGVLAGGIAHDFNNILAGILGNLNLVQLRMPESDPKQRLLDTMETGLLRGRDLIAQLSAYAGRAWSERRPVRPGEIVGSITELLRVSVSRRVNLVTHVDADVPAIVADPRQVQQVLLNLVTNAAEAIGAGTGKVRVSVSSQRVGTEVGPERVAAGVTPGHYVRVVVEDDGAGIAGDILPRIFEPFFTTRAPGRGLGLSAVRGILQTHDAPYQVVSRVGQGTTFTIWFPAFDAPEPAAKPPPTRRLTTGGTVLFVDDDALLHATIPEMLRSLGLEVECAFSGEEAVERVRMHPERFRMVLLDLTMPGIGGAGALPQIRALRPELPVIVSSGDRARVTEDGIPSGTPFLAKPFTLDGLRDALAAVLG